MVPTKDYLSIIHLFILYYLLICVLYFVFRADAEWPSLVPTKDGFFSQAFLSLVPIKDGYFFFKQIINSLGWMHNGLACSLQRMDAGRGWLELQE